jgi:hypothetical protein
MNGPLSEPDWHRASRRYAQYGRSTVILEESACISKRSGQEIRGLQEQEISGLNLNPLGTEEKKLPRINISQLGDYTEPR